MQRFAELKQLPDAQFKRTSGVSKVNFQFLLQQVEARLASEQEHNPMKRRGRKGESRLEDKLLLTLYYLRHYPTFLVLGQVFGLSESYSHKIYQRYSRLLVQILPIDNRQRLMDGDLDTVIVDVSEQPVERPKQGQKADYSGKKKAYAQSAVDCLCRNTSYLTGRLRQRPEP